MKNIVLWMAVVSLAAVQPAAAQLEVRASRAAPPPRIDGRLDDACWSTAGKAETFLLNTNNNPASEKTAALVCYDDQALYVAFVCRESEPDKIVARHAANGSKVPSDDCVELFLDIAHDRFNYLHFIVNPVGAQYDEVGDGAGVDTSWDAPWLSAAARTAEGWTAEMAIPFAILGINKRVGPVWGVNFCRQARPKNEQSSWSPLKGKFAQPAVFGKLAGLEVDFSPFLLPLVVEKNVQAFAGENELAVKLANAAAAPRRVSLELIVAEGTGDPRTVRSEPVSLAPGVEKTVALKYSIAQAGLTTLTVRAVEAETGRLLAAAMRKVELPPLAEFVLMESYYRNDALLRVKLNARKPSGYALNAELHPPTPAATTPVATARRFTQSILDVTFDVSKLPAGDYVLKAAVVGPDGKPAAGESLPFARLRAPGSKPGRVSIREDNMLLVDGKPFFPIGVYYVPYSDRGLSEAAKAGFNLALCPGGPMAAKALKKFEEYGLMAWVPIGGLMKLDQDKEARAAKLKETVERLKNEKALLVWESVDEPVWGSNTEGLLEGYRAVKALDPDHPVWTNHAPRNTIAELARFNAATDITGCDIYPVPEPQTQSDLPNKTIAVVADETQKQKTTVADRKPIWMVLQGFAWAELRVKQGGKAEPVYPTYEQSRFMAYDAIVHGARGILYWGTRYTERPSRFLNDVKRVASELSDLTPVLTAPDSKTPLTIEPPDAPIKALVKDVGPDRYVFAVNESAKTVTATFAGIEARASQLAVFGEARNLPVVGGKVKDSFGPYAVHVYSTDTTVTNLVANGSFEKDVDDDELPDGWELRVPFSGGITRAERRTGRYSVSLSGDADDANSLWIQSKLDIAPDRPYRCSAWMKGQGEVRVYVEGADGKRFYTGKVPPLEAAAPEWKEMAFDFTMAQGAKQVYVVLQLKGKGRAWFDDVRIFHAGR